MHRAHPGADAVAGRLDAAAGRGVLRDWLLDPKKGALYGVATSRASRLPFLQERRAVQPAPEEWLAASGGERTSSAASDAAVSDDDGGAAAQRCGAAPAFLASLYETEPVQVTAV